MMNKPKRYYYWEGFNLQGEKVSGIMETLSVAFVKHELFRQGISSKKIIRKRISFVHRRKTQAEISLFYRQTATLLKAGIPLLQSFDIVAKSQVHLSTKCLLEEIKQHVENGFSFSEALRKHSVFFNELTCNLISVGEKSGNLDIMLEKVSSYKEKIELIKRKLKKALHYPIVVLLIASLVSIALLTFVVPQFEVLFKSFGASLPLLTLTVIQLSIFFRIYGLIILCIVVGLSYWLFLLRKRLLGFSQFIDKLVLKLPILGAILSKAIIARFTRTLAISFAAGFPLGNALKSAQGVTANSVYTKAIDKIRVDVYAGQQMHLAMRSTLLFPNLAVQMVAIGEQSGTLESMLDKIADFYEDEISDTVDNLSNLLEPIMMTILGLIVGGLVIAMYLPIFKLGLVV